MHPPFRRAGSLHWRRTAAVVGALGTTAIVLAACGSSTTASDSTARTTPASATHTPNAPPGVSGTIAALADQSMEVQNPRSGQTTVTYTTATTFTQTIPATSSAVVVGACVRAVVAPPPSSSSSSSSSPTAPPTTLVATTVLVDATVSGSCGRGGPAGFGGFRAGRTTRAPRRGSLPADRRRRASSFGRFAVGRVAATTGTSFTVTETNPTTSAQSTVTVDTTSSTTFSETEQAAPNDLAVGKCVRALGPASSTGAVAARSVTISSPGPNGCAAGFRAGGFGAGRSSGSGPATSAGSSAGATA
ncbi:MAG: DUF5666 domain-containing protein [Acidimicrobiales bacterium]